LLCFVFIFFFTIIVYCIVGIISPTDRRRLTAVSTGEILIKTKTLKNFQNRCLFSYRTFIIWFEKIAGFFHSDTYGPCSSVSVRAYCIIARAYLQVKLILIWQTPLLYDPSSIIWDIIIYWREMDYNIITF